MLVGEWVIRKEGEKGKDSRRVSLVLPEEFNHADALVMGLYPFAAFADWWINRLGPGD